MPQLRDFMSGEKFDQTASVTQNCPEAIADLRLQEDERASAAWLSEMLTSALLRDPIDAANDAEQLLLHLERGDPAGDAAMLAEGGSRFWLQRALLSCRSREPGAALSDAAMLFAMLNHRANKLLEGYAASKCS